MKLERRVYYVMIKSRNENLFSSFLQLRTNPFGESPNPDFLYLAPSHSNAMNELNWAIERKKGFSILTGEVGTGKTLLGKSFLSQTKNINTGYILHTDVDSLGLLRQIAKEFSLNIGARSKQISIIEKLHQFLIHENDKGRTSLLVIDEAHKLPFDALETIRLLTNLENSQHKLLQVLLLAQPEILVTLDEPSHRQIKQRIAVHSTLDSLNLDHTRKYIHHRIEKAGGKNFISIDESAFQKIYKHSGGNPRLINRACEMILAHAESEQTRIVTKKIARQVLLKIEQSYSTQNSVFSIFSRIREKMLEPTL